MENLKLISVRIGSETLQKIDQLASTAKYRNRSQIIQNILKNVIECADDDTIWKIIDLKWAYDKGYIVNFNIDAQECLKRNSIRE